MAQVEKKKTLFSKGAPSYSVKTVDVEKRVPPPPGGQPVRTQTSIKTPVRGQTLSGTGRFDPTNLPSRPIPRTYQEIITRGRNLYVSKLNEYPYIRRRNDILQLGDSRDRSEKYPPESLLHMTGGTGYAGAKFDDGFIRGGIVLSTARAAEDVIRVGNFMKSRKGVMWILREAGLQMTNPRPETRFYNPATTLLQVASTHLGVHLPRHGLNPFNEGQGTGILDFGYNTYSTVKDYAYGNETGTGGKRYGVIPLVAVPRFPNTQPKIMDLTDELIANRNPVLRAPTSLAGLLGLVTNNTPFSVGKYSPPRDKAAGGPTISTLSYLAATNSPYGGFSLFSDVGMHRAVNTQVDSEGLSISKYPRDEASNNLLTGASRIASQLQNTLNRNLPGTIAQIVGGIATQTLGGPVSSLLSMRARSNTSTIPGVSTDILKTYKTLMYGELAVEKSKYMSSEKSHIYGPSWVVESDGTIKSGPPKSLGRAIKLSKSDHSLMNVMGDLGSYGNSRSDVLNTLPPNIDKNRKGAGLSAEELGTMKDLAPFIFYDIATDTALVFRATFAAISDTFNPTWNEYNYVGNPQTYYTYMKTTRDFAFTFRIATLSESELKWNWMKLNRFVGMVYPTYSFNKRMIGPFIRLTVGDMLSAVPGFISALTVTIDDNTPWEINLFANDAHLSKLPHVIDCAVTFRVVGDEPLESTKTKFYNRNKMYSEWKFDG
jgi:hypothetical protein